MVSTSVYYGKKNLEVFCCRIWFSTKQILTKKKKKKFTTRHVYFDSAGQLQTCGYIVKYIKFPPLQKPLLH